MILSFIGTAIRVFENNCKITPFFREVEVTDPFCWMYKVFILTFLASFPKIIPICNWEERDFS